MRNPTPVGRWPGSCPAFQKQSSSNDMMPGPENEMYPGPFSASSRFLAAPLVST
jgi:hypothetical protein